MLAVDGGDLGSDRELFQPRAPLRKRVYLPLENPELRSVKTAGKKTSGAFRKYMVGSSVQHEEGDIDPET